MLFLLSIPVGVQAQGGATGAMSGTVQDSSGAERQSLKVSVEFFNLTNTTSFANPTPANNFIDLNSVSPTSSTFEPITSIVGTPRLIRFALRYSY